MHDPRGGLHRRVRTLRRGHHCDHRVRRSPVGGIGVPSPAPKLSVAQLKQRAAADSASMMAQFPPPPGAKKLTKAPTAAAALLARPAFAAGSFDSVDSVSWWQAPGSPQGLLAWEEGHMPSQFQVLNELAVFPPGSRSSTPPC